MSDRTAAELFSSIFQVLASDKPINRIAWAHEFWRRSKDYDFSPYQLYCDDALVKLGLAVERDGPDGSEIGYGPDGDE